MRFGMIGTGRIAQRFVKDIKMVRKSSVTVVYHPKEERSHWFVSEFFSGQEEIPTATGNLEELFRGCDCVYIASPHETHYGYAKAALEAGKHVLCEKPMALCRKEAEELFDLAKERGLILREAVKTAYCPGFLKLLEVAKSGVIGEICDVEAAFTKLENTAGREFMDLAYGGSMTELGTYGMLPIFKLLGCGFQGVEVQSLQAPNGVDKYTKIRFSYENAMATAKVGLGVKSEGQLLVSGTKGYILAESPWWLTKRFEVRYEDPSKRDVYEEEYIGQGLVYEILGFLADCEGQPIGAGMTREESCAMADVMGQFLQFATESRISASRQEKAAVGIWAHRGESLAYPENTLIAFDKAAQMPGISGIELDVQLTKDGEVVVFHDETLDRVACGKGRLTDRTLEELRQIRLKNADGEKFDCSEEWVRIPTFEEVLRVMEPYCRDKGLKINVELKTSVIHYEGLEEKCLELVKAHGLEDHVVWSSFWAESVKKMKELDPKCETAMLADKLSDCIKWGTYSGADGLHPSVSGMDCELPQEWKGHPVRAWNSMESLYHTKRNAKLYDLREMALWGVTDIFTNITEKYLGNLK